MTSILGLDGQPVNQISAAQVTIHNYAHSATMSFKSPHSFLSTSTRMEPVVRVYIVRHGETNENRAGIIQGQLDTQLNDDGILQARFCAERLKNVEFVAAFTSDLHRAAKVSTCLQTTPYWY